jgi:hypothetical protein
MPRENNESKPRPDVHIHEGTTTLPPQNHCYFDVSSSTQKHKEEMLVDATKVASTSNELVPSQNPEAISLVSSGQEHSDKSSSGTYHQEIQLLIQRCKEMMGISEDNLINIIKDEINQSNGGNLESNDGSLVKLATAESTSSIDSVIRRASESEDDSMHPTGNIQNGPEEHELVINRGDNGAVVDHSPETRIENHQLTFSNPEVLLTANAILAREEPLTSDELVERYKAYQAKIEMFFEQEENRDLLKSNRKAKIELRYDISNRSNIFDDSLKIDEGTINLEQNILDLLRPDRRGSEDTEDQIIKVFTAENKLRLFADILEEMNDDQLVALTHRTVDYLKRAIHISDAKEEQRFREIVAKTYIDAKESPDKLLSAHILYEYYKLQQRKDKWVKTCNPVRPAFFCLSGLSARNGKYKRDITNVFEAYKQRRDHLTKKYDRKAETRGNSHGKERYVLDELIQLHQDYIEEDAKKGLPREQIIKEIEQVRNDLSQQLNTSKNKQEIRLIKSKIENVKTAWQTFTDCIQYNPEGIKMIYENKKKKFERRSGWWNRANDVVSVAGIPLGIVGSISLCT